MLETLKTFHLTSGDVATVTGLILYFEELANSGKDHRHPPLGHDAVTLITYHGAKGLKWPAVVLCGLDSERDPDAWVPVAHGGNQSDTNPLDGRLLTLLDLAIWERQQPV